MTRYLLVPAEGEGESMMMTIPTGLMESGMFTELQEKIRDKERLRWLLRQFNSNGLTETCNGFIQYRDTVFKINLRSFLIDSCNLKFLKEYEELYELLRNLNVKL